jgi:AraC family transcriptional regulator
MLNPYDLFEGVLASIEEGLKEDINIEIIAGKFDLSVRHLQRMFKFAFNQTIGLYIRSRKLAASIDDLFNTGMNVLDIALEYGFEYESSYIRSFQREYGITPGNLRQTGKILSITPPLQLFNSQKYPDGVMFGPDIVMVLQFHVVGKKYKVPFRDMLYYTSLCSFGKKERQKIPNAVDPNVLICISYAAEDGADHCYSISAAQVKTLDDIPEGFDSYTFPTSLCARFRFINNNSEGGCNMYTSDKLYQAITDFMDSEDQKYFLERKRLNLDIINFSDNGGTYTEEWLSPVIKKTSLKISPYNKKKKKKVYQQELPALRFIGKKCIETSEAVNVLNLLDNWQLNSRFNDIEKQSGKDLRTFFDGGDSYIDLVRKKDGSFEHWMGMFVPEGTNVPEGYEAHDFPKMTLGICRVYGKRDEIVNYEAECRNKAREEGYAIDNAQCYFLRFNWRGFFEEDIYGKRLLDYCYPVK